MDEPAATQRPQHAQHDARTLNKSPGNSNEKHRPTSAPLGALEAFADNGLDGGSLVMRRIVIASDHRGFEAKCRLLEQLGGGAAASGREFADFGCEEGGRACDYPDYAIPAAGLVASGAYDGAILLDGSGIGMGIAANKVRGVRAATCHDEITARIAREHNHCNVLCVGVDLVGLRTLFRVVETFLDTPFSGGRHVRRVAKLCAHEDASFASFADDAVGRRASSPGA